MKTGWRDVAIGGVQQWVSVRGEDPSAPVLLFLHGGPGGSEYGPRRKYLRALERRWRVVDWEQRGAGRSFRGDEDATVLTLDRLVLDGVELVEWICNELAVERVVLVGHSFGTVLGVLMSQKAAGRIGAYVGAAQVVQWAVQEELGYDWALAEARRQGKARAFDALERLGRPAHGMYAAGVRSVEAQRRWLGSLGGVSADRLRSISRSRCADVAFSQLKAALVRSNGSQRRARRRPRINGPVADVAGTNNDDERLHVESRPGNGVSGACRM
jgi:proline iminopeptidase